MNARNARFVVSDVVETSRSHPAPYVTVRVYSPYSDNFRDIAVWALDLDKVRVTPEVDWGHHPSGGLPQYALEALGRAAERALEVLHEDAKGGKDG